MGSMERRVRKANSLTMLICGENAPDTFRISIKRSGLVPVVMCSLLLLAVILVYIISVAYTRLPPFIPFISHAAAGSPQSAVFGILLFPSSIAGMFCVILRYNYIRTEGIYDTKPLNFANKVSLYLGVCSFVGMVMVSANPLGTGQVPNWVTTVLVPHMIGSLLLFGGMLVYLGIQSYFSFVQRETEHKLFLYRSILYCVYVVSFFGCSVPTIPALTDPETHELGLPKEFGFAYMLTSISEWIMAAVGLGYFLTFKKESHLFSLYFVCVRHKECPGGQSGNSKKTVQQNGRL